MTRVVAFLTTGGFAGMAVGAAAAARWLVASSSFYAGNSAGAFIRAHPRAFAAALAALAAWAVYLFFRTQFARAAAVIVPSLALIGAICLYVLISTAAGVVADGSHTLCLWTTLPIGLAAAAAIKRSWVWTAFAGIALIILLPQAQEAHLIFGDTLAREALAYNPPPGPDYYARMILSLAVIGGFAGCFAALLNGRRDGRLVAVGALCGALFAVLASSVQTLTFFVAMGSGHSPVPIVLATAGGWTAVGVALAAASPHWRYGARRTALRFCPGLVVLGAAVYAVVAAQGHQAYEALDLMHTDTVYAYVHFAPDGTWRRTLDHSASRIKAWRARRFLSAYPFSAYRPAAMLAAAESEFDLWRFAEADAVLDEVIGRYPGLRDYARVLKAITGLAAGDPRPMLSPASPDSVFARWRAAAGAQMAASAAERADLPVKARGYHSAYIDFLRGTQGASWTSQSAAHSASRMDAISAALKRVAAGQPPEGLSDEGRTLARAAQVNVQITAGGLPLRGARVVLAQPHVNAALPGDSQQFTGARSVAAWNGFWAMTDRRGVARIAEVPFGRYQVVLGLDFATSPPGIVATGPVPEVVVDRSIVFLAPIDLAPAVRLISPGQSESVRPPVRLSWQAYPGAVTYSVSVVLLSPTAAGSVPRSTGSTCWARADITDVSVALDPAHFVGGHTALRKGASYSWIVYAYDSAGRLLSSSEHYFDLTERVFRVR